MPSEIGCGKDREEASDYADGQMGGKGVSRHAKTPRGGPRSEVGDPRAAGTAFSTLWKIPRMRDHTVENVAS